MQLRATPGALAPRAAAAGANNVVVPTAPRRAGAALRQFEVDLEVFGQRHVLGVAQAAVGLGLAFQLALFAEHDRAYRIAQWALDGDGARHTLRHTAITHLDQAGVDLPTVKRISGHKTLAMVERYVHAKGAHIQTAMDKLQARFKLG
jgi:integrase